MTPRIDPDTMMIVYESGDRDAALTLVRRAGFELAQFATGRLGEPYRRRDGNLEQRIVYATAGRDRDRANKRARHQATKQEECT